MNLRDYTLKLGYKVGGKEKVETIDGSDVFVGFKNDDLSLKDDGVNGVKITLSTKKDVELTLAEVIYTRFYENGDVFFANGFQSWTVSREYTRNDVQKGLFPICKLARWFAGASGDYHFTQYARQLYHSFTYTYIRKGGRIELFGSLNERTGYTIFYADMKENVLAAVKDVEGLRLDGGKEYELFNFIRTEGSYDDAFDVYFAAYPRKNTGRVDHFAGYTSWYNYYQNIDEKIILRDLEGLRRAGDKANIFQIDDGFETKVGDWKIDAVKFPHGLRPIVDKIHSYSLKAGLWLAPFSAEFKAEIVKEHPEWLIQRKGKPLTSGAAWGGFYALDFELDEVKAYIRDLFRKVFDEWGFDMVKLDFLYSAAVLPRNGKTRGQLMCEAMDFLRECCGDKIILGCGVPLGPAFGVVDACRIGCDAETSFKDRFYVRLTNQEIISTRNAMNNTVFRRHLNRIFANDPDVFFLREGGMKPAKYTMQQKRLLAKVNRLFGRVLFVSDDVGEYDDEKMQILLEAYTPFDGHAVNCENYEPGKVRIDYMEGGEAKTLIYDVASGDWSEIV